MRILAVVVRWALALLTIAVAFWVLDNTPSVRAEDDHGDFRSLATTIQFGAAQISGNIDPTAFLFDVDYFSFEALRGVRYTFVLDFVTVDDANIQIVNSKDRGAGRSAGQILTNGSAQKTVDWIARTTDVYYVEVSGTIRFDGTPLHGSYLLTSGSDMSLKDRYGDDQYSASPVYVGNVYQGALSPWTNQPGLTASKHGGDDWDYFYFDAGRGVKYTVDIELGSAEGLEVSIVGASGGIEASNNAIGTTLEWIAPSEAKYFIAVSGSNRVLNPVGTYSLKLSSDDSYKDRHSHSSAGATSLSFGNAHQGAVSPADDRDVFIFRAERGVRYNLRAELGTAQGIELAVEELDGALIVSNGGVDTGLQWLSPADGDYFIVVSGSSLVRDPVGTYTLTVDADALLKDRHGEAAEDATAVSFGNQLRGAISPANDRDFFSFIARRGVRYSVGVTLDTAPGVEIAIIGPAGRTMISNGGSGSTVNWTSETNDTYFIAIAAPPQIDDPIGTYSLKLENDENLVDRHGGNPGAATPVAIGSTYQASISPKGDVDFFTFGAIRGVKYTFELGYGTAGPVSMTVSNAASGLAVARNFGEGTDVIWTAPDDDDYTVSVSGSPRVQDSTGTYSFKIREDITLEDRHSGVASEGTKIIVGNAIAGAISPRDDLDYFIFEALRGESYVTSVELGTADSVRLTVTQPLAGFTKSNYSGGSKLEWQAPITGMYVILITASDEASESAGSYQITMTKAESEAASPEPPLPKDQAPVPTRPTPPEGSALIVSSRIAPPGATALVPIMLQETAGLTSLDFTLNYDPAVAEVVSVSKGARLTPATFSFDAGVPGAVRLSFSAATSISGGSVAIVEIRVNGEQDTASLITLSDVSASNSSGGRLLLQLGDGLLTAGQPALGDGNGDGQITVLDALIALRMSMQLAGERLVMDVNGDGSVTQEDVQRILVMARPG